MYTQAERQPFFRLPISRLKGTQNIIEKHHQIVDMGPFAL